MPDLSDDRQRWIDWGHALKREHGDDALDAWLGWSSKSALFNDTEARERWNGFRVGPGEGPERAITCASIIREAKVRGWKPEGGVVISETAWPAKKLNGTPDPASATNAIFFLNQVGVLPWTNTFDRHVYIRSAAGKDERLSDDLLRDLRMQMHEAGCRISTDLFQDAVLWRAQATTAHPVLHYLSRLEWDGGHRIDKWLSTYLGAADNEYTRAVGPKYLIAGARRPRDPACKFDTMLVLEGPQYAGKSTVFSILAGEYFTDSLTIGDDPRKVIEDTAGAWLVELSELSGLGRRDVEAVKAFASRQRDRARAAYDRHVSEVPRQFILGGTTNEQRYLMDTSGNRRFWCVEVGKIDLKALRRDRDQLWAEAAHREAKGEAIHLSASEYDRAVAEQLKRQVIDPVEDRIRELLSEIENGFVVTEDLFASVGLQEASKRTDRHTKAVARVMRDLKWNQGRKRCGAKRPCGYYNGAAAEVSTLFKFDIDAKEFRAR